MDKSAHILNFRSRVSRNGKTNNEKIENLFLKIKGNCEERYNVKFEEEMAEGKIAEFQEEFRNEIERKVIRNIVDRSDPDPEEIFKRSRIIKEKIDTENFTEQIKNMISLSVIRGYFTACKYFMKKRNNEYINSFTEGLKIYEAYPNKSAFDVLLEDINFKTGPLSEEDIKLGKLYFKNLHEKSAGKLEKALESTGCFGISGRRGMGKSTLLNVCMYEMEEKKKVELAPTNAIIAILTKMRAKNPTIVKLTVPSKYEPEEFLTALLSKICEEIKRKGDFKKPYRLMNVFDTFYKLLYSFLILLGISLGISLGFFLLPNIIPIFPNIYYRILIFATLLLGLIIILSIFLLTPNQILTYRHVDRIYSDIKFKKTFEITGGVSSKFFSFGRRTTFVENPINYSTPLLSDKIKELIERITEKTFNKVIIIIDDFDKLEKSEYDTVLKSIRFLSSTKNCLTFIAVPEGFKNYLEDTDSEVRTLFDQFIELEKIKNVTDLQELIEHRIMNHEIGREFSKNKQLIKHEDDFYEYLLSKSEGVPREAIRLFSECFLDWSLSEEKPTIDDKFYSL